MTNETNKALMNYEELKKEQLAIMKDKKTKTIVSYLNENKNALKSIRNFLNDYSGELTDDYIRENLQDDAKHLIKDIANSKEKCYLGLYKLNEIERDVKNYAGDAFWDWADTLTKIEPYNLQNQQLDIIILKYLDKFDFKETNKHFDRIIQITENNASSNSLKVFSKLICKLRDEFEKVKSNKVSFGYRFLNMLKLKNKEIQKQELEQEKDKKYKEFVNKASRIFEALNHIVEHHYHSNSYLFYLEMNPDEIEEICVLSKSIRDKDLHINWQELLMRNLVDYYVSFAKTYINVANIGSLSKNWKLQKIFEIIYDSSNDINLQERILDSFSVDNTYLPYLPLNIIESTINKTTKLNNKKLMKVIFYLEKRFKLTNEQEQKTINELNNRIITDLNKNIEIRQQAFNWFYDVDAPSFDKSFWCSKIFNTILNQENSEKVQNSLEFKTILEKCFSKINDKESIKNEIINYIPNGKNKYLINLFNNEVILKSGSLENLQNLILKFIEIDDKNKINLLCEYITNLYAKISENDDFVGIKGIDYLCSNYEESTFKKEIENSIKFVLVKSIQSKDARVKIFKKFIEVIEIQDKELFVEEIYNSKLIDLHNIVKTLIEASNADSNKNIVVKYTNELIKQNMEPELFKQISDYLSSSYNKTQDKETGTTLCAVLEYSPNINQTKLQVLKNIFENLVKTEKQFLTDYIEMLYSKNNDIDFNLYVLNKYFSYNVNINSNNIALKSYIDYIWDNNKYDTNIKAILKEICKSNNVELIEYVVSKGWKK